MTAHAPLPPLGSPAFFARPDAVLERLRRESPVHYDPGLDAWFLTRYAEVAAVLRDPACSVARAGAITGHDSSAPDHPQWRSCQAFLSGLMVVLDPPEHTHRRGLIARAFTRARLEAYRPQIRALADEMVTEAVAAGSFELLPALAAPLPGRVIAQMLGVPPTRVGALASATETIFRFFGARAASAELVAETCAAIETLRSYFGALAQRRGERSLSPELPLAAAATLDERVYLAITLLAGSLETTSHLAAHALIALLETPGAYAALVEDPSLCEAAVEEAMRFDGPALALVRTPTRALEVGGVALPAGARVYCMLHAANHDPEVFEHPERFELQRHFSSPQLGFGFGPHFCLGAWLSRMEVAEMLRALVRHAPNLRLDGPYERFGSFAMRGVRGLRLTSTPSL